MNTSTAAHGVPDPNGKRETRKPSGARASAIDDAIADWKGKSRRPRVKFSVGSGKKSRRYTVLTPQPHKKPLAMHVDADLRSWLASSCPSSARNGPWAWPTAERPPIGHGTDGLWRWAAENSSPLLSFFLPEFQTLAPLQTGAMPNESPGIMRKAQTLRPRIVTRPDRTSASGSL